MIYILLIFTTIYLFILISHAQVWSKMEDESNDKFDKTEKVSIVIAARNEENSLEKCIAALSLQIYPPHLVELIIIDDHSEDETYIKATSGLKTLEFADSQIVKATGNGKKSAISQAVQLAKHPIILTTDADCQPLPNWVEQMVGKLMFNQLKLVCGTVQIIQKKNFLNQFQVFEQAGLIAIGAASIHNKKPNMANGASMCFCKDTFVELKAYADNLSVPSGDDEFLLAKINEKYPHEIGFLKSKNASVFTMAQPSFAAFINQRVRWASKAKFHKNKNGLWAQLFLFIYFLLIWLSFIQMCLIFNPKTIFTFACIILYKIASDFLFYYSLKKYFNLRNVFLKVLQFQFLHILYLPIVAIKSLFGNYKWKNRKY